MSRHSQTTDCTNFDRKSTTKKKHRLQKCLSLKQQSSYAYITSPSIFKIVLSVVWTELATNQDSATENFETVLSSLEMPCGPLKTVWTCRQLCSHHQDKTSADKTVLSCLCRPCELALDIRHFKGNVIRYHWLELDWIVIMCAGVTWR